MLKLFKYLPIALSVALTACGGGGGSAGETQEAYTITLRADKTKLPLNISGIRPGTGVYRPYTTTLYVEAKKGGAPIPGGKIYLPVILLLVWTLAHFIISMVSLSMKSR